MNADGKNIFQIVIAGLFVFLLLIAVLIFSGVLKIGRDSGSGSGTTISLWGTLPVRAVNDSLDVFVSENKGYEVRYRYIPAADFNETLVSSLARGAGPDLILLGQDDLYRNRQVLSPIPYTIFPERSLRDTYVEETELLLGGQGLYGFPLTLDPLVLYYNRDHFSQAGIATPPKTWADVLEYTGILTEKDAAENVTRSAIALGEYDNVRHAKDILAALFMQTGTPIISKDAEGSPVANVRQGQPVLALEYYTSFSDPISENYTWNKGMPDSRDAFLAGRSSMYIGYAGELFELRERNPNLNFDVVALPQAEGVSKTLTHGRMTSIVVSRGSQNRAEATAVARLLSSGSFANDLAARFSLPPVQRAEYSAGSSSPYVSVFYSAGLTARSWLDPDPAGSSDAFRAMVNDTISGKSSASSALGQLNKELELLLL